MYGLEWGVINNGGHMNIFNTPELLGWEYNGSGQLIADTLTAKGDYAGLYTLMRQRGWVGQFNHPAATGQFLVNGVPFGYTADGDQAMAMCEVLNTSAFSTNTTETETSRSTYEGACKKALEAGYHVAFTTDQDNHCANWGASYTNRTGVLIPNGTALTQASFIDALKARRVFATMDKGSQLVLTANGHIMGERFTNSGSLNLVANFASSAGKAVSTVLMYEGVPGRNGTVTQLSTTANTTITPADRRALLLRQADPDRRQYPVVGADLGDPVELQRHRRRRPSRPARPAPAAPSPCRPPPATTSASRWSSSMSTACSRPAATWRRTARR